MIKNILFAKIGQMQDARDGKKDHEKQREEGIKKRTMNLPNSLDIEEEEEDNQEIENSYINEIRSLKATIKRLHNIICNLFITLYNIFSVHTFSVSDYKLF